jgi:PAS domain S-box-containing protein
VRPGVRPAPEFLALAEPSPDSIVLYDLDGVRTYINPACTRAMGPKAAERVGTSVTGTLRDRARTTGPARAIAEAVHRVIDQGRPVELPLRWGAHGGPEERVFQFRFVPQRDPAGTMTGVLGVGRDLTARTRAEEALARSEARLQLAFQEAHLGMAVLDQDARLVRVNPALARILGHPEAELVGSPILEHICPEDRAACEREGRKLAEGRVPSLRMEFRGRRQKGRAVWLRCTAALFRGEGAGGSEYLAQFEDISAQRSALDQLQLVDQALAKIRDGIFVIEFPALPDSRIIYVNDAACRSLGYRREELLALTIRDFDPDMDQAAFERIWGGPECPRRPFTLETRHRARNGRILPVEVRSSFFRHRGRLLNVSVVRDLVERRKAQGRVEDSERAFLSLAESALDCISLHDASGRLRYTNGRLKAFLQDLGLPAPDVAGGPRHFWARMRRSGTLRFRRKLREVLRTGQPASLEQEFRDVQGRRRTHQLHLTAERNAAGGIVGVLAIGRDVTAWREHQECLEAIQARLRELAVQLQSAPEQSRRRIARDLHEGLGPQLAALRDGVRALDRLPGQPPGRMEPLLGPLLHQVDQALASLRNVCGSLRPEALDTGLAAALGWLGAEFASFAAVPCSVRVRGTPPELDEERTATLFRIAQEALNNVAKHARAGAVRMLLAASRTSLRLEIRDDGAGFEPASAGRPGAFGLLGIRERARAIGADFRIDSAPGRGTRIRVRLPLAPARPGSGR